MEQEISNYISKLNYDTLIKNSPRIKKSYKEILKIIKLIKNKELRKLVLDLINNPIPSFLKIDEKEFDLRLTNLKDKSFIDNKTDIYNVIKRSQNKNFKSLLFTAPGANIKSHNCFPGGLINHTLLNLKTMLNLIEIHSQHCIRDINRDYLISAMIFHDLMKSWILQWENHEILKDCRIAGAAGHHVFILAELIHRGIDPEIIQYTACVHKSPYNELNQLTDYFHAASILANKNIYDENILIKKNKTDTFSKDIKLEHFIMRYSEKVNRDFSLHIMKKLLDAIKNYCDNNFKNGDKLFHPIKNIIFTQKSEYELLEILERNEFEFNKIIDQTLKNCCLNQ